MVEEDKINYIRLGMKAGLEVHQQLDVGGKLFCRCPACLRNDKPNILIKRKLHLVPGETGEVDIAVEHEAALNKDFFYEGYSDTNCLLEYDECPPYPINSNALDESLKIALLLNCEIYTHSQIMRKTVIDGSNTSGFQRTVLIGHDGYLETSFGKVGIDSVALEEDAARIIRKGEKEVIYRLDRLGIPLVEIGTKAELKTPEQIKETALKIGEILRACKVKRGIGTIRQDLNISIKGHDRVEIKGFQEPRMMSKTVELEIERQKEEIKKGKKKGEVRNAKENGESEFLRPMPGRARMYPETDLPLLNISRDKINEIKKNLPKLKHEIRDELKKKGVSEELIPLVLENLEEFEVLLNVHEKDANLIAKMTTLWRSELASKYKKSIEQIKEILNERVLEKVLEAVNRGELEKTEIRGVLIKIVEGEDVDKALKVERINDNKLEEEIVKIVKEKPGLRANAYMGMIIQKLGKDIDKKKAMEILNRIVK